MMTESATHNHKTTITEGSDLSYVECINQMLANAEDCKIVKHCGCTVYLLQFNTFVGVCQVSLFQNISDGVWYDFCVYRLLKTGAVTVPITRTMSNPAAFCKEFLYPNAEYAMLCIGGPKPVILRGIRQFASIPFDGEQVKCQFFLNGNDLYIKLPKYIMNMRCVWLKISSFAPMCKHLSNVEIAATVWSLICAHHQWDAHEYNIEWKYFLQKVAKETKEYLAGNERMSR